MHSMLQWISILPSLQALYNLAFMVEHNYSLDGIHWNHVRKEDIQQGNLTFASHLYRKYVKIYLLFLNLFILRQRVCKQERKKEKKKERKKERRKDE